MTKKKQTKQNKGIKVRVQRLTIDSQSDNRILIHRLISKNRYFWQEMDNEDREN